MDTASITLGILFTIVTVIGGMLFADGHHRDVGLWTAFVGIVLGVAGGFCYWQARLWAHDSEKTSQSTINPADRPWVSIEKARIVDPPSAGTALKTALTVKNRGKTPAHIETYFVRSWSMGKWHGFPRDTNLPTDLGPNPTIIAQDIERELIVYGIEQILTKEEAAKIVDKGEPLFVQFVITNDNSAVTVGCYTYLAATGELHEFGLDNSQRME